MKFHPYAEIFPLLDKAALNELAADIKLHGLREAIWTYENQILDGRNRYLACEIAGATMYFRPYRGDDPLGFVISLNVQRRHLDPSQRALAAAKIATLRDGQRKSGAQICAPAQSEAAQSLNVSRRSVQTARKVLDDGSPSLVAAVERGEVAVSKAAAVLDKPKRQQLAAALAEQPAPIPELADDWAPTIEEEAYLEAQEREYQASMEKVMAADDKLAAAHAEIKRQAAEIAVLKVSRDGFMNGKTQVVKMLKAEQNKVARLRKELEAARKEARDNGDETF